jgi:hypothetical protein
MREVDRRVYAIEDMTSEQLTALEKALSSSNALPTRSWLVVAMASSIFHEVSQKR